MRNETLIAIDEKYGIERIKKEVYSGIICDVLDQMGYREQALTSAINGLNDETVIFGPAFTSIGTTVYSMPEHPRIAQTKVVDQLGEGEIYVLVTRGEYNCAVFGEIFATRVMKKGGAGVLLDANARDLRELKNMSLNGSNGFPVFFRGKSPLTSKGRCEINECQIPIIMDGACGYSVTINPGDYIFGDIDGVVIIPKDIIMEVLEKSFETIIKENETRDGLLAGKSLQEVYEIHGTI